MPEIMCLINKRKEKSQLQNPEIDAVCRPRTCTRGTATTAALWGVIEMRFDPTYGRVRHYAIAWPVGCGTPIDRINFFVDRRAHPIRRYDRSSSATTSSITFPADRPMHVGVRPARHRRRARAPPRAPTNYRYASFVALLDTFIVVGCSVAAPLACWPVPVSLAASHAGSARRRTHAAMR